MVMDNESSSSPQAQALQSFALEDDLLRELFPKNGFVFLLGLNSSRLGQPDGTGQPVGLVEAIRKELFLRKGNDRPECFRSFILPSHIQDDMQAMLKEVLHGHGTVYSILRGSGVHGVVRFWKVTPDVTAFLEFTRLIVHQRAVPGVDGKPVLLREWVSLDEFDAHTLMNLPSQAWAPFLRDRTNGPGGRSLLQSLVSAHHAGLIDATVLKRISDEIAWIDRFQVEAHT